MTSRRADLILTIARQITGLLPGRTVRVGVDGVDGAGKTTFADELAGVIEGHGRAVVRASVDGFHNPRAVRYRRGRDSPDGFYLDSYDYGLLREVLLDPLGPGGSGLYVSAAFDHAADSAVARHWRHADPGSVLVFDGIFLHRPELRDGWDFSVFLDVPFRISVPRGAARGPGFGSPDPEAQSNRRYVAGQERYLAECEPHRRATVTVDNSDTDLPSIAVAGGSPSNECSWPVVTDQTSAG